MKKITIFVAAIVCALGLTACGAKEEYSKYQQEKIEYVTSSTGAVIQGIQAIADGSYDAYYGTTFAWDEYTMEEVAYVGQQMLGVEVDGYGFYNALTSFKSADENLGSIIKITTDKMNATVTDEQIIVTVPVVCEKGNATVEVIYSNDMFCTIEAASITQDYTMGEKMQKAALNTLIGISTVFVVLILICLLISLFGFIPKIQKAIADSKANKETEKNAATTGIENAVNQIIEQETADEDTELVAVIAAAIAAYEGAGSTDGYVVRSIRRRR